MALQSRQQGTVKNYRYGWGKWREWASQYDEVAVLPAEPIYVALYLYDIYLRSRTPAPVNLAFYAISWAHRTAGIADPTAEALPKMIKDAAPRTLVGFSNKKDPLTVDMLKQIVYKYAKSDASIMDMRLVAMILVAFAGFLRYQELSALRVCDIVIYQGYMKLFIEHSKTDVNRIGSWVFIASTGNDTCPVSAMSRYLAKAGLVTYSEQFVFRGITRHKVIARRRLRDKNVPLAYTTARTLMLAALGKLGYDITSFGTHSLRSGGATAAAKKRVEDRLFKKHGRWLSEKSKDRYVHEDVAQKLIVTQSLGI